MRLLYRFVRFTARYFVKFCFGHKVYGVENLPKGAALLAANHASYLDPPIMAVSSLCEVHFLARGSLFQGAIFNYLIRSLNAHPVTGSAQDASSFKVVSALLKKNQKVVLFVEGFRSYDGTLQPVKKGVALLSQRCHVPIIPIYIYGSYDVWPRQRLFPKLRGKTACIFGTAIDPAKYEHLEKKEGQQALVAEVQRAIEQLRDDYLRSNQNK